ncbi:MAG: FAD-binding oxidoreductase [Spirochaetaceae bacterium]|nr:MAG: FAD-binding oxidoreductase [Spirochaetaceae bacterium]
MPVDKEWLKRAADIVGADGILVDPSDLESYGHDEYALQTYVQIPKAVVKPSSEEQVGRIVGLCAETGVPITPRGGGTGLSAACVSDPAGIVLSLERLNKIVEADPKNHVLTVQAGVTLEQINGAAEEIGLFFPPHPGDESAMAGGMVATNAGGARAVKYGTIKRFVLGLQVVLASGQIVDLGGTFMKASMGYSLMDLMIGSEGTLGIITRVTLALLPRPGSIQTLLAPFATVAAAIESVPAILERGTIPFAVEFVERSAIACAERLVDKSWPAHQGSASLLLMLDGPDEDLVLSQAEAIGEVLEAKGALDIFLAESRERQEEILGIRSMIYEALRPGTAELFDVCVPRSQIAGHVEFVHSLEEKYGVPLPTYGHAADGNVHTNFMRTRVEAGMLGEEIPDWPMKHEAVRGEIFDDVIRRKGIISGEHGIGLAKRDYLINNLGETNVALMRSIKKALDPRGILNPGKIFRL